MTFQLTQVGAAARPPHELLARRITATVFVLASLCAASSLSGCSESPDKVTETDGIDEPEVDADDATDDDTTPPPKVDAGKPPTAIDAGTPKPPTTVTPPKADAGTVIDAGVATPPMSDAGGLDLGGLEDLFPTGDGGAPLGTPGDRTPSPDNIPECPKVAPENPIGDCLGIPIYATCSYTTYTCICDWYHWLCI
jgi:hypothetical protein